MWSPRCDPTPRHSHRSTIADSGNKKLLRDQKRGHRRINSHKMTQRNNCCFRWTLQACVFTPSALNAFDYDFPSTRHIPTPSSETLLLISPQKPCSSPTIFTECKHLLLLITSPELSALLLRRPNQPTCMYTHTQTRTHAAPASII